MTRSLPISAVLGAAMPILVFAAQAHAEGNRLLPFWGQPYPYGYARAGADVVMPGLDPCRPRRGRDGRQFYRDRARRCDVVLHARD